MADASLRYRAFLSYSHRDGAVAQRLHRRLEGYRVPSSLRRADGSDAPLPPRLHPVFRDRDELASSGRLSTSIEQALDESEALVVVCSPAAASSPWVDAEIAYFRRQYPQRPVLAFVVDGDPGLDPRQHPQRAALPLRLALLEPDDERGALGEPLAADARAEADGFTSAFFKLAAGLLGVRYDDLRQRDHRRRQRLWTFASTAGLALAIVFAWLAWDATRARNAARGAQAVAELELRSERQTREFLLSVFELADATEARGERVTVREVLDRAVARIEHTRFDRDAIRARFLATMGQAYASLGLNRRGTELLRDSIGALQSDASADAARQRVESRLVLADLMLDMGDYDAALAELDAVDAGTDAPSTLQRARAAGVRGDVLTYQERDAEATAAFRVAQQLAATPGIEPEARAYVVARALAGQSHLAMFANDLESAQSGFEQATTMLREALGDDHPHTIGAALSWGSANYRAGDRARAREIWEQTLAVALRVYDPDGPQIGTLKNNLGLLLFEDGDLAAAEPMLRDALASDRRHRSEQFDDLAYPLHNLGYLLLVQRRHEEAEPLLREALTIAEAGTHRMLGPILNALADLECGRDQAELGLPHAQRAIDLASAAAEVEADAWRAAQARITAASCGASSAQASLRRDLGAIRARWPQPGNPFVRRATEQLEALQR